jgi:GNAT superfamily N-acetyltransferase
MNVYTVRTARPEEFTMIGELMVRVYSSLPGFPTEAEQPSYYHLLRNVGLLTEKPEALLLVAAAPGNEIAGTVLYVGDIQHYGSGGIATRENNSAGFRLLAVAEADRGKGVGKLLTQACIDRAKEQGRSQLILHTTMAMQTAWKMYERMGFSRSEDLDFMQGDLAVHGFRMRLIQR